jgi:hypothetical protein
MRRRGGLLLVPVVLHGVQHALEGSRHGGGLCDSGSGSGSGSSEGVVRVVGAIEGCSAVRAHPGISNSGNTWQQAQATAGSIFGFVCVVSKCIVEVNQAEGPGS